MTNRERAEEIADLVIMNRGNRSIIDPIVAALDAKDAENTALLEERRLQLEVHRFAGDLLQKRTTTAEARSLGKPRSRAAEKQQASRAKEAAWQRVRRQVLIRDGYRCRACGSSGHIDVHHLKLRSAGGTSTMDNLVALDRICHSEIHAYRLFLVGGNANNTLRVERAPCP